VEHDFGLTTSLRSAANPKRFTLAILGKEVFVKDYRIDGTMRLFLSVPAIIIWLGIWLTGCDAAHWVFYIPAVSFTFAVITGICPGMMISKLLMKKK